MKLDDYTRDAVCRCLGLPGFEPEVEAGATILRILLMPSFDPEVCITFVGGGDVATISVVAASAMIWRLPSPQRVHTMRGAGNLAIDAFSALDDALRHEHDADLARCNNPEPGTVRGFAIDGMPYEVFGRRPARSTIDFGANAGGPPSDSPLAVAIEAAWNNVASPACRNALAVAGKYASLSLPLMDAPPVKPQKSLLILGSEEDTVDLENALRKNLDP